MQTSPLIMYHKHPTSARVLFLRLNDTVCHFDGLPSEAGVVENQTVEGQVVSYPPTIITDAEQRLGFSRGTLEIEAEFQATVETPDSPINVYLANFTTNDPPHEHIAELEGKFIALTEARRLPPAELELLRLVYSFLMDG